MTTVPTYEDIYVASEETLRAYERDLDRWQRSQSERWSTREDEAREQYLSRRKALLEKLLTTDEITQLYRTAHYDSSAPDEKKEAARAQLEEHLRTLAQISDLRREFFNISDVIRLQRAISRQIIRQVNRRAKYYAAQLFTAENQVAKAIRVFFN